MGERSSEIGSADPTPASGAGHSVCNAPPKKCDNALACVGDFVGGAAEGAWNTASGTVKGAWDAGACAFKTECRDWASNQLNRGLDQCFGNVGECGRGAVSAVYQGSVDAVEGVVNDIRNGDWRSVGNKTGSAVVVVAMTVTGPKFVWSKVGGGGAEAAAETGVSASRAIGLEGERLAGINPADKIRIPTATGYRIPDSLTATALTEVKNVGRQSLTSQIRDYLAYAQANNLTFNLVVRLNTKLTGPLQELQGQELINVQRRLPAR